MTGDLAGLDLSQAPGEDLASTPDGAMATVFTGQATYYNADGTGSCGFPPSTDFMVAAMNHVQYQKSMCGMCVAVTGPQGMVTVRIVDLCPACKSGDLDLSETAFSMISPLAAGRVAISWSFVPCP
jgi:expansin (peptidoglycan-binding protein)